MKSLFEHVHDAFHAPETRTYRWVNTIVWVLIVISGILVIVDLLVREYGFTLPWLEEIDLAILIVFTIEISLRVLSYRPPQLDFFELSLPRRVRTHILGRLIYCLKPLTLIDILTVVAVIPALRSLRILRLLRLLRTQKIFRYANPLEGTMRSFRDNAMLFGFGFSLIGVATLLGGISFYFAEKGANDDMTRLTDGFWWAIVSLTTVGYGDISPVTESGRMIGAGLMIAGMFTLALFAGIVGHTLLHTVLSLREEQVRVSTFVNHIVICGYDPGARMLLDAIEHELGHTQKEIMVFAPGERPVDVPPRFMWQSGEPTKESELPKVRLTHADAVIIVGSRTVNPQIADAQTILTAFTIRSFIKRQTGADKRVHPLYIAAEVLDQENVEHARTAGCNEVIETTRLGFSLLAHATVMHGTGSIMSRVATAGSHNIYTGSMPEDVKTPIDFQELGAVLKERFDVLLLGIRLGKNGEDQINPHRETDVPRDAQLIYLATEATLPEVSRAIR